jgi:hypothetical protein
MAYLAAKKITDAEFGRMRLANTPGKLPRVNRSAFATRSPRLSACAAAPSAPPPFWHLRLQPLATYYS